MPDPARSYDVSALTSEELQRTRRELAASLALTRPGSPARIPILTQIAAIDVEVAQQHPGRPQGRPGQLR
jgi:hypothetical protein